MCSGKSEYKSYLLYFFHFYETLSSLFSFSFFFFVSFFFFFFFFFLLGCYEVKSFADAIDVIMKSFQVILSFKNNRKTYRALTGGHEIISTKSFISLELTMLARQNLVTMLLGLGCKNSNAPNY